MMRRSRWQMPHVRSPRQAGAHNVLQRNAVAKTANGRRLAPNIYATSVSSVLCGITPSTAVRHHGHSPIVIEPLLPCYLLRHERELHGAVGGKEWDRDRARGDQRSN